MTPKQYDFALECPTTPVRVAYLCEYPTVLGGETSLLAFLQAADRRWLAPVVICPGSGRLFEALVARGIEIVPWPHEPAKTAESTASALAERGLAVDIVHANSLSTTGIAASLAERLGCPAVAHVRDIVKMSTTKLGALHRSAAVIAVSKAVAQHLVESGVEASRVNVIYNAASVPAFTPAVEAAVNDMEVEPAERQRPSTAKLSASGRDLIVACIGQICLRKAQDVFIDAAALLANRRPDLRFALVGERYSRKPESVDFEARLRAASSLPPLVGRVEWRGYLPEASQHMGQFDLIVVCSRQEPFSRVLIEALASGVPVVATDVGGNGEILDRGRLGPLVRANDASMLSSAIAKVLDDDEFMAFVRTAGPSHIRRLCDPSQHTSAIMQLYRTLLVRSMG